MKMEKEYNLLTKKLLSEGYTADNHPDYVYVGKTCQEKEDHLRNLDGGFEYYAEKTFKTPCGLQCRGKSCMTGLSIGGVDFTFENDMPTIECPYRNKGCLKKNEFLRDANALSNRCNVHMVDEEYKYEGSVEGILKLEDDRIQREKISFILERNGRICENHMRYDHEKNAWVMDYDPCKCATVGCHGNFGWKVEGERSVCPILGRALDAKKGNVFYDVKTTYRRYDLDGTLFEGQVDTHIEKGVRFLKRPVSMDICRNIFRLCKDKIKWHVKMKYHHKLFFAKYHGRQFSVEVLNIRAEQKEGRDLLQDLDDIRNGIQITHASDTEKAKNEMKGEQRQKAKEKRIKALEKKLLEVGYHNLETHSIYRVHADKWLGVERIKELEKMRQRKIEEEQNEPKQISLFDFPEVMP